MTDKIYKNPLDIVTAIKNADDDVLDSVYGKEGPERKLVGGIKNSPQKVKYYKHPQVDGIWHDTGEIEERYGNKYNIFENEEGHPWGITQEFLKNFEEVDEPRHPFKLDREKYPDVEETPYGFIYNVGNTSIEDIGSHAKRTGIDFSENENPGFSVFIDGDEVWYPDFESAYKAAKGIK